MKHRIIEREGIKWYAIEFDDGSAEFEPVELGAVEVSVIRTKYGLFQVHTDSLYCWRDRVPESRCYVDTRPVFEKDAFRLAAKLYRSGARYAASHKNKARGLPIPQQPQLSHAFRHAAQ